MVTLSLPSLATPVLVAAWIGAAMGVTVTLLWIDAPRWSTTASYLMVGWIALAVLPELYGALGATGFSVLAAGGVLFTLGGLVCARERPDPLPAVFGYHEVFHALVILAVTLHFGLIASPVR